MKEFIDATIFMGMHSSDEKVRIACKNFFIERMKKTVFMSLENVGKCDDVVWQFDRETQDVYYPFMDRLHTVMDIQRIPYDEKTLQTRKTVSELNPFQQLTLTQSQNGKLFTFDKALLNLKISNAVSPETPDEEKEFPDDLEKFYQESLKLSVTEIEHLNQ
ncbi:MAG: hypothetical protein FJ356_05365 [Thaumarchaeota archaeon]|nr:hypothetical protein [Nitrososphaerota archaeon]